MNRKMENAFLSVEVSDRGAELMRVVRKDTQTDLLWNGNPAFWNYRSPILFPNVGSTYEKKMKINGKVYQTRQHGFAREKMFTCVEEQENRLHYRLLADEETRKYYPFDFILGITYELKEKQILVTWEVENQSRETMSFTIGGHPGFMFENQKETKEDYELYFPEKEELTGTAVDLVDGTGKPERKYQMKLEKGTMELSDQLFDVDTLVFDGAQVKEVWLRKKKSGQPYVGVRCIDTFYSFGIWSLPKAPYICLEPWAGRCDDEGFTEDIAKKTGINQVEPGACWKKQYAILVG